MSVTTSIHSRLWATGWRNRASSVFRCAPCKTVPPFEPVIWPPLFSGVFIWPPFQGLCGSQAHDPSSPLALAPTTVAAPGDGHVALGGPRIARSGRGRKLSVPTPSIELVGADGLEAPTFIWQREVPEVRSMT